MSAKDAAKRPRPLEVTATFFDHLDIRPLRPAQVEALLPEAHGAGDWVAGGQVLEAGGRLVTWRYRTQTVEIVELSTRADLARCGLQLPLDIVSGDAVHVVAFGQGALMLLLLTRGLVLHAIPLVLPREGPNAASISVFADLPDPSACHAVALRPPADGVVPTACAWAGESGRLFIGFSNGMIRTLHLGVEGQSGRARCNITAQHDMPVASGWRFFGGPNQPTSRVLALACARLSGGEVVLSLHADGKLWVWSSEHGTVETEWSLPDTEGAGIVYTAGSKLLVVPQDPTAPAAEAGTIKVVATLASGTYSRVWYTRVILDKEDLVQRDLDWRALPSPQVDEPVMDTAVWWPRGDNGRAKPGVAPLLWVLTASGPYCTYLEQGSAAEPRTAWKPPEVLQHSDLLPPRDERGMMQYLREQRGRLASWSEVAKHVEGTFLRVLFTPGRYSAQAVVSAADRMSVTPEDHTAQGSRRPQTGSPGLTQLIASSVRTAAARASASVGQGNGNTARDRLRRLVVAWWHALELVRECHEVESRPLALIAPGPQQAWDTRLQLPLVVRADRVGALVKVAPHDPEPPLAVMDQWLCENQSTGRRIAAAVGRYLAIALETSSVPDPAEVVRVIREAIDDLDDQGTAPNPAALFRGAAPSLESLRRLVDSTSPIALAAGQTAVTVDEDQNASLLMSSIVAGHACALLCGRLLPLTRALTVLLGSLPALCLTRAAWEADAEHLVVVAAKRLTTAWLLSTIALQPQLSPSPCTTSADASLSGEITPPRSTLQGFVLDLCHTKGLPSAPMVSQKVLPSQKDLSWSHSLLGHLERTLQYRHTLAWTRGMLNGALVGTVEEWVSGRADMDLKTATRTARRCEELLIMAYLSEARRLSVVDVAAASRVFDAVVASIKDFEKCLVSLDEDGEDIAHSGLARLEHYRKAVKILEANVAVPGCGPRRVVELAQAGLRGFRSTVAELAASEEGRDMAKTLQALTLAANLQSVVFRQCMDEGAFEEAFLAMRAEQEVAMQLKDVNGTTQSSRRGGVSDKLGYFVIELVESGRLDLVCSLPWQQSDAQDEVAEVENTLRQHTRYTPFEFEATQPEGSASMQSDMDQGLQGNYYEALFAFVTRRGDYRTAALEMYNLSKAIDDVAGTYSKLPRVNAKIQALSASVECLQLLPKAQRFIVLSDSASGGGPSNRRTYVVTIKIVRRELAYMLAMRAYLQHAGPNAPPVKVLDLARAQVVPGQPSSTGLNDARRVVEALASQLCGRGLFESAASLLQAMDMPLNGVVERVVMAWLQLQDGRSDAALVEEDGPGWAYGSVGGLGRGLEEGGRDDAERDRYGVAALQGAERARRERADAAHWFLRDLVTRLDSHRGGWGLHTDAVRWMVITDSYMEIPSWLSEAFIYGRPVSSADADTRGDVTNETGTPRVEGPNQGALLQVHADKAWYLWKQRKMIEKEQAKERIDREVLTLLMKGLTYASQIIEAKTDKLTHGIASASSRATPKLWLPSRQIDTLVACTRRVQETLGEHSPPGLWDQLQQAEGLVDDVHSRMDVFRRVVVQFEGKLSKQSAEHLYEERGYW